MAHTTEPELDWYARMLTPHQPLLCFELTADGSAHKFQISALKMGRSNRIAEREAAESARIAQEAATRASKIEAHKHARLKEVEEKLAASGGENEYILHPWPIPVPVPNETESCDFDIPAQWKPGYRPTREVRMGAGPQVPAGARTYKSLRSNLYRAPAVRQCIPKDEYPICSCTSKTGCGELCENRALFMECSIGLCPSLDYLESDGKAAHLTKRQQGQQQGHECPSDARDFTAADACADNGSGSGSDSDSDSDSDSSRRSANSPLYCSNTVIQRRAFPKLEVFGTAGCGYALRVLQDVSAGSVLVEYLGEAITSEEMHQRISNYSNDDDFYFAALGDGLFLDAKDFGSIARFANHSCSPTGMLQKWIVHGEPRICLVPTRALKAGEEVTYNYQYYQDGLDTNNSLMTRQVCRCGSARCCGTIGGRVEESPLELWLQKTETMLERSRNTDTSKGFTSLGALQKHVDQDAPAVHVPGACREMQELRALLSAAETWQTKVMHLQAQAAGNSDHISLLTLQEAKSIVDDVPKGVRFDELAWLKDLIRRMEAVDKDIQFFEESSRLTTLIASSELLVKNEELSKTLPWVELMRLFKAVQGVLPLRCKRADFLFYAYQQVALWVHRFLGTVIPADYRPRAYGSYSQRYKAITRCSIAYGASSILIDDVLVAEAFLEENMTTALSRADFDPNAENMHAAFDSLSRMNLTKASEDVDVNHSSSALAKVKTEATEELHCLCNLPEDEGESSVMICCDTCEAWYHCNCINAPNLTGSAPPKRKSKAALKVSKAVQQSFFECPLCAFREYTGEVHNNFSAMPRYEWTRGANKSPRPGSALGWAGYSPGSTATSSRGDNTSSVMEPTLERVANINSSDSLNSPIKIERVDDGDNDDGKHKASSAAAAKNSVADTGLRLLESLPGRAHIRVFSDPSPGAVTPSSRSSGYLTIEGLLAGIKEESHLIVSGNPVLGMLHLYRKYTSQWLHMVETFQKKPQTIRMSSQQWALNKGMIINSADKPLSSEMSSSSETAVQLKAEVATLEEALKLYNRLGILRIRPVYEIAELRKFIWTVTSAPLLTRAVDPNPILPEKLQQLMCILPASTESGSCLQILCDALQEARPTRDPDVRDEESAFLKKLGQWSYLPPSYESLMSVLEGGFATLTPNLTGSMLGIELYNSLKTQFECAKACLEASIDIMNLIKESGRGHEYCSHGEPGTLEGLPSVSQILKQTQNAISICRFVNIQSEFPFASLLSLTRCILQVREKSTAQEISELDTPPQRTVDTNTERYCWCRHAEGGHMISCDNCSEWFHAECISRGVTKKELSKGDYICPGCCILLGKRYVYSWSCRCTGGGAAKRVRSSTSSPSSQEAKKKAR